VWIGNGFAVNRWKEYTGLWRALRLHSVRLALFGTGFVATLSSLRLRTNANTCEANLRYALCRKRLKKWVLLLRSCTPLTRRNLCFWGQSWCSGCRTWRGGKLSCGAHRFKRQIIYVIHKTKYTVKTKSLNFQIRWLEFLFTSRLWNFKKLSLWIFQKVTYF